MAIHPRRKSDAARRANQIVRSRTVLVMLLLGIMTFAALFWRLYDLQIRQHAELQEKAISQQTRSAVVSASRGTIYDRNLNTLAISATAETVLVSPLDIEKSVESQKEEQAKAAQKAADKGQDYTPPVLRDQSYIARGLSRILGLEQGAIEERMEKTNSQYEILKKKTDQTISDEVRRFINGEIDPEGNEVPEKQRVKLRGVWLQPDSKRYYLYSSLASGVIGFVNGDGIGSVGLEAKYDDTLTGTAGYTVSARNASGSELLYNYEQYYDAENGHSLVLTLDANVQLSLENGLENMLKKYDAKNGGTGIVMEVNTGAIIAMASYPNYDLNDYGTIFDAALQKKLDADLEKIDANRSTYESEKAYADARAKAINSAMQSQWRNKCIDSTYEPGSTFKPITLAAALEEGKVSKSSTFYCGGYTTVPGWSDRIWCSNHSGHGQQTLIEAVGHSCNPAFIKMGLSIGTETYYKYLKSFGLMDKTGIDMIGEVKGLFVDEDYFNSQVVSLASYSFGQTFNVTPIELIRAQAACINGGYLYEPYIVDQVLDEDGNVLSQHDTTPVRQVISEETSAIVREALEYVVSSGSGKNGQVAGYRIGGKTGTADKTGTRKTTREVVVSFMCFAPADDPQYIMLLTMDTPSRNTGTAVYGGTMVAPTASQIMGEILPALGIEPDYSAEELSGADAAVPYVVGKTAEEAKAALKSAGFTYRTVGSGETVTDQTPAGGAIVPNNASVVLYLGAEKSDTPSTVPDVTGKTPTEANKALTNAGLIMKVAGATSASGGSVTAISQNAEAGSQLPAGSVVTVRFGVRTTD
ncbi:penicillin-binding transpeptidase domain-containing protein [Neopoerus faecalis]|uniref:penicillin-binding transpeptidase domain-containing protein n=1 Tax=Neopoerus faecalis TaxID=3032125 RepID=UPI00256FB1C4|nr:penicillin-binding transpeptidase domain-containing protein [Neopoerus faecalis]